MTKISFLISAYKAERFMDRRLRNLLSEQTDKDVEVIVIDSASPENERATVDKWAVMFPGKVKYIRQPERTPYGVSWNVAYKMATGEFCTTANADDFCHPNFVSRIYATFKSLPDDVAFLYTGLDTVSEDGRRLGSGFKDPFDFDKFTYECWAGPTVTMIGSDSFRDSLNWDLMNTRASQYHNAYDYWLWLYFMSLGYKGHCMHEILIAYTKRSDSVENSNKWQNNYETYAIISEMHNHHLQKGGRLKHAREFADFNNLPPKEEWIEWNRRGKKWRHKK